MSMGPLALVLLPGVGPNPMLALGDLVLSWARSTPSLLQLIPTHPPPSSHPRAHPTARAALMAWGPLCFRVKYEDPQATDGLAGALDARQQSTGVVSSGPRKAGRECLPGVLVPGLAWRAPSLPHLVLPLALCSQCVCSPIPDEET